MGTYCYLQIKRLARFLPGALCVVLVLLIGLLTALTVTVRKDAAAEENQKVRIALVGTAEDGMIQMGLAAMRSFDSTQFSMELVEMTEEEAHTALQRGKIGAYLVMPDGFMDQAMDGNILPIKFVSTTGAAGMVTIFKEEVSRVIASLLLESQQGVYGMQKAMRDNEIGSRGKHMTDLAMTYVEYVLVRDKVYQVNSLGISDALELTDYLACGLAVLLLHLACLPFAPLMIRRDLSLGRMLSAKGKPALLQSLCDFGVYLLGIVVLVALFVLAGAAFAKDTLRDLNGFDLLLRSLPVLVMVCSFSFLLYALTSDLISGVLLQFFLSAALCFVSGCMYPVHFFPVSVQRVAAWLPAGLARSQLAGCVTGTHDTQTALLLLGYSVIFCAVGMAARVRAVKEARV